MDCRNLYLKKNKHPSDSDAGALQITLWETGKRYWIFKNKYLFIHSKYIEGLQYVRHYAR